MENKSSAVKREILKNIVERFGTKPKRIVIQEAKERGVYKNSEDDDEVYELVRRFAEYHKMPFGYVEPKPVRKRITKEDTVKKKVVVKEEIDEFFESLIKERDNLSKKLLALNRLIETYKL